MAISVFRPGLLRVFAEPELQCAWKSKRPGTGARWI